MRKRTAVLLALLTACSGPTEPPAPTGPNVLIISTDTTRVDRVGCYGYESAVTPNMDALARDGVRFTSAYSPVPLTLPAHSTLLSGVHPKAHGVHINMRGGVHPDVRTLAQEFQSRGFRTGAFLSAWVLNEKFGLGRGFDEYDDVDTQGIVNAQRTGEEVADSALSWLGRKTDAPFFAWVHFYDPHTPYRTHPEYAGKIEDAYDAEIAYMDVQIGRLLEWLDETGVADKTIVVLVADHGEDLDDHGEEGHGIFLYDTTQRVPMLVRGPAPVVPGTVVDTVVGLVDVAPTIHDLMGWEPLVDFEGRSLADELQGAAPTPIPVFLEAEYAAYFGWSPIEAVVTDEWKYIEAPEPELYRRDNEFENVADVSTDMVTRLRGVLAAHREQRKERDAAEITLTESDAASLAALGYAGSSAMPLDLEGLDDAKAHKDDLRVMLKAIAFMVNQQHDKVVETLEPNMDAVLQSPDMWITLGGSMTAIGRHEDAIVALEYAATIGTESASRLTSLADAQLGLGRKADAYASLEAALLLEPNRPQTHSRLGRMYGQDGQYQKAIEHFQKYVAVEPNSANAHTNLANALFSARRFEEGRRHLLKALSADPQCGPAHSSLIQMYTAQGKRKDVLVAMRDAARGMPRDGFAAARLSWELSTSMDATPDNAAEALEYAMACVGLNSEEGAYQDVLAAAYANMGDFPNAISAARTGMALSQKAGNENLTLAIQTRLGIYESGQPYRRSK